MKKLFLRLITARWRLKSSFLSFIAPLTNEQSCEAGRDSADKSFNRTAFAKEAGIKSDSVGWMNIDAS